MKRPRLGFLGVGWIGRSRLAALAESGVAEVCAIADPSARAVDAAAALAPEALRLSEPDALFEQDLDGVVIATPSAQHAEQSIAALTRGLAVFCQKPLGRDAAETRRVVEAARAADRRLGVDFSYRHTAALAEARERVRAGDIGRVFAADLAFHNAYGPDRPWFYERRSSGACLIDLGIHLVDAALWTLGFPRLEGAHGKIFAAGERLMRLDGAVEDYAAGHMDLGGGGSDRLLLALVRGLRRRHRYEFLRYARRPAVAQCRRLVLRLRSGQVRRQDVGDARPAPDAWGGRALIAWATALAANRRFDTSATEIVQVADTLDAIYRAAAG